MEIINGNDIHTLNGGYNYLSEYLVSKGADNRKFSILEDIYVKAKSSKNRICNWTRDDECGFDTECKHGFMFNKGGVKENSFEYCPYCGEKIEIT